MIHVKEFRVGTKECIENEAAYGIENDNENLAGIIAVDKLKNEILWLASVKRTGVIINYCDK